MPDEKLPTRRIRVGSEAFKAQSEERKQKLLAGEPLREGGVILVIVPAKPGETVSAKKRGRMAARKRKSTVKPEGAKKLTTTRDRELTKKKLEKEL